MNSIEKLEKIFNDIDFENMNDKELLELIKKDRKISSIYKDIIKENNYNTEVDIKDIEKLTDNFNIINSLILYLKLQGIEVTEKEIKNNNNNFVETDSFKMYKRDISSFPILTREEENEYFKKLHAGDLSYRKKIANSNLKLVLKIANSYYKPNGSLQYSDLVQEGNLGLMTAIDKFDENLDYKFSTYAIWWIRQAMIRALNDKSRMIRIPANNVDVMLRINRIIQEIKMKENREPSIKELSEITGLSEEKITLLRSMSTTLSLDHHVDESDDESTEFGQFLASDENVEDKVMEQEKIREVRSLLENSKSFNLFTYIIIKLRFGIPFDEPLLFNKNDNNYVFFTDATSLSEINDFLIENDILPLSELDDIYGVNKQDDLIIVNLDYPLTLEEIGNIFGITKERVRQLENKHVNVLRRRSRRNGLKEFCYE